MNGFKLKQLIQQALVLYNEGCDGSQQTMSWIFWWTKFIMNTR
jgi:hypothetical protein